MPMNCSAAKQLPQFSLYHTRDCCETTKFDFHQNNLPSLSAKGTLSPGFFVFVDAVEGDICYFIRSVSDVIPHVTVSFSGAACPGNLFGRTGYTVQPELDTCSVIIGKFAVQFKLLVTVLSWNRSHPFLFTAENGCALCDILLSCCQSKNGLYFCRLTVPFPYKAVFFCIKRNETENRKKQSWSGAEGHFVIVCSVVKKSWNKREDISHRI